MLITTIIALLLCSAPGPAQVCGLEGSPTYFKSIEACEARKAIVNENYAQSKAGSFARCVSKEPEWKAID